MTCAAVILTCLSLSILTSSWVGRLVGRSGIFSGGLGDLLLSSGEAADAVAAATTDSMAESILLDLASSISMLLLELNISTPVLLAMPPFSLDIVVTCCLISSATVGGSFFTLGRLQQSTVNTWMCIVGCLKGSSTDKCQRNCKRQFQDSHYKNCTCTWDSLKFQIFFR